MEMPLKIYLIFGSFLKAKELGLELDVPQMKTVLDELKQLEHVGYHFEAADASLELLMRRATGWRNPFFTLESFRVMVEHRPGEKMALAVNPLGHYDGVETEATIKLLFGDQRIVATGEGNGPVNALDAAFRSAANGRFPELEAVKLTDYKVRSCQEQVPNQAPAWAGGMLLQTRLLLDSPATQDVELVGYGVATGAAKLESVRRKIQFPADKSFVEQAHLGVRFCADVEFLSDPIGALGVVGLLPVGRVPGRILGGAAGHVYGDISDCNVSDVALDIGDFISFDGHVYIAGYVVSPVTGYLNHMIAGG